MFDANHAALQQFYPAEKFGQCGQGTVHYFSPATQSLKSMQIGEDDTVYGENAVDTPLDQWGGDKDGTLIDGGEKLYVNRETVTGSGQVLAGSKGEQDHTGTKSNGKGLLALKRR